MIPFCFRMEVAFPLTAAKMMRPMPGTKVNIPSKTPACRLHALMASEKTKNVPDIPPTKTNMMTTVSKMSGIMN